MFCHSKLRSQKEAFAANVKASLLITIKMGDISDYYVEKGIEGHIYYTKKEDYSKWTTRDGIKIRVKNMTNDHLINTLNMLNRAAPRGEDWFDRLSDELISRGLEPPTKSLYFQCDATEIDIY